MLDCQLSLKGLFPTITGYLRPIFFASNKYTDFICILRAKSLCVPAKKYVTKLMGPP